MITFHRLGNYGRLGNYLFQYAALKGLGLKTGYEVKIPDPKQRETQGQVCLLDHFNIEAEYLTESDVSSLQYVYREPDYMKFDPELVNIPDNTSLEGYFQSTFYFQGHEDQIAKELTPKKEFLDRNKEYVDKVRKDNKAQVVSLHLRRGDNTDGSNPSQALCNMYGSYTQNKLDNSSFFGIYLKEALKQFKKGKVVFLVFSGGARGRDGLERGNKDDLAWCRDNFSDRSNFVIAEPADTLDDFCRIMACDHNINSHVSTFGWWASFIGQHYNKEKLVVAPDRNHPDHPHMTHRGGYYPKEFILV